MVKITYMPWKEIVVHEVKEANVQQFLEMIVAQVEAMKQGGTPIVNWVSDIAFVIGPFPDTPEVVSDKLNGKIHYGIVTFTRTSYQPEKRVTYGGREYMVRLVRAEDNPDFVDLASFLRNFRRDQLEGGKGESPVA